MIGQPNTRRDERQEHDAPILRNSPYRSVAMNCTKPQRHSPTRASPSRSRPLCRIAETPMPTGGKITPMSTNATP